MKKQERKLFIKSVHEKIQELNDLDKLCDYYQGFNNDFGLFDFYHCNYTFTISTDENGVIYLADNVDVYNKHGHYYGNYYINIDDYLK